MIVEQESKVSRFRVDEHYTYSNYLIDIPSQVVLENDSFEEWQVKQRKQFCDLIDTVPLPPPQELSWKEAVVCEYGTLFEYVGIWPNDSPLYKSTVGGTLAIPKKINTSRSLIVFIHGHGMVPSREERVTLFAPREPAAQLLEAGYIVWAPDNVYHEELMELFKEHDFSIMWAKTANQMWPLVKKSLPPIQKRVVLGIAAGGLTGIAMAIVEDDVSGIITGGAYFSLELTRRDYRIKGHPFCHDFRRFASYLPVYALALGKPLEIQMGQKDGLWVGQALEPNEYFSGTKRGTFTEEVLGGIAILRGLSVRKGSPFSFVLHPNGHTDIDLPAALDFISTIKC